MNGDPFAVAVKRAVFRPPAALFGCTCIVRVHRVHMQENKRDLAGRRSLCNADRGSRLKAEEIVKADDRRQCLPFAHENAVFLLPRRAFLRRAFCAAVGAETESIEAENFLVPFHAYSFEAQAQIPSCRLRRTSYRFRLAVQIYLIAAYT